MFADALLFPDLGAFIAACIIVGASTGICTGAELATLVTAAVGALIDLKHTHTTDGTPTAAPDTSAVEHHRR